MKKTSCAVLLTAVCISLSLSTSSHSAPLSPTRLDSCSCQADDGTCSATVTCSGGCNRYCGNDDNCWAECSGFFSTLAAETNLEISYGTYSQLVAQLAQISGRDITFSTSRNNTQRSDTITNLGFKKAPLWSALEFLSDRGTVRIGGKDFDSLRRLRKALLAGERVNFGIRNTPVNTFVTDLTGLTGLPFRITSGRQMALTNVELSQANLTEIVNKVSEQTGTRIVPGNEGANP